MGKKCYNTCKPQEKRQIQEFGGLTAALSEEDFIMNNKATIMLSTINDVKEFVSEVSLCDYDVDLISGRYAVDAKSIMGIFSLDLSKPIKLEAQTEDATEFFAKIKQFIVE